MTADCYDLTSIHVRAARAGDEQSIAWIIHRFGPLLLAQARHRLAGGATGLLEPEDLVQETWAVALPRLPEIEERAGRVTPVLLRFLATTQLQLLNNLLRKLLRRGPNAGLAFEPSAPSPGTPDPERRDLVLDAIETLEAQDRAVVVLRAIEGLDNGVVANLIGCSPNACSLRYNRALARLRQVLGPSVFDEID
ncbi:MAG: sigma-70 family RNA polymerase sigma factor [Planctomycetes bacterium]|nr:sigma-70 family RNA polymerase sigma factor [Planctomycetota bacterium]